MNCDRCRDTGWVRNPEGVWQPFMNDAVPCPCGCLGGTTASKLTAGVNEAKGLTLYTKEPAPPPSQIIPPILRRLQWADYMVELLGRFDWDAAAAAAREYKAMAPPPQKPTPEALDRAAKAAFLAHWPNDRWERFGDQDYVKDQYRAIAKAVLEAVA